MMRDEPQVQSRTTPTLRERPLSKPPSVEEFLHLELVHRVEVDTIDNVVDQEPRLLSDLIAVAQAIRLPAWQMTQLFL